MLTTDQVLGKGRYRIISSFTSDESGGLYEAYDTTSNTNVVLRETIGSSGGVMTPAQLDEVSNAFAGEAKALTEVHHDSVLSVQDYFSEIDRHYLVMESVDGSDFTRFLDPNEKPPALNDLLGWVDQILDALNYLHNLQIPIIHRDIRPANVRLTSSFKVKLLTSGISAENADMIMASADNVADNAILNYRPIEQLWGGLDPASQKVISNSYDDRSRRILMQPLDARSDIYSVGATLYHVLTRTLPKDALERSIEILDGNNDPLASPADLDPSIPEEISEIVMKAMELRREHRYDSAAIVRQILNSAQQQLKARKTAEPKPRVVPEPLPVSPASAKPLHVPEQLHDPLADKAAEKIAADLKAAQEKERAEHRRKEIEADLERQRQEAERIKAAEIAAEAAKKPEIKPAAESSLVAQQQSVEDFLLEVEPVKPADDKFEWSIDVSEEPARRDREVRAFSASNDEIDFNIETGRSPNTKVIAVGAGSLVIVVAILGWVFMGGSSSNNSAQAPAPQQQSQEQTPVSSFADPAAANTSSGQVPQISETVTVDAHTETNSAAKQKKTPTPAKTPEKKKVTVDDLINDN